MAGPFLVADVISGGDARCLLYILSHLNGKVAADGTAFKGSQLVSKQQVG